MARITVTVEDFKNLIGRPCKNQKEIDLLCEIFAGVCNTLLSKELKGKIKEEFELQQLLKS